MLMLRKMQTLWLPGLVALLLMSIFQLVLLSGSTVFAALNENFSLEPGSTPSSQKAVADAWDAGGGDKYDQAGWKNIKVYVKDFATLGPTTLSFDEDLTKQTACDGNGALPDSCESREPVFTQRYYCTVADKKISYTKPAAEGTEYYEVIYAVALQDNGNKGDDFVKRNNFKGYAGVLKTTKFESKGNSYTRGVVTRDLTHDGVEPGDIDDKRKDNKNGREDNNWGIDEADQACRPAPDITGSISAPNFNKLPEAEKATFQGPDGSVGGGPGGGAGADGGAEGETGTNCAGGAMGWLFCPMINAMAKTIQLTAGLVDNLMTVKFLSSESGGASIEQIWRAVLSVANIMLVIAFMFIIFSQSSSLGLSNYGIKRMLPRLIIAAILMNLSFYICAIAIDFSNIIGASVMGFLLGSGNTIASSVGAATEGPGAVGSFLGGVVGGIAVIALLFFLLTPLVLGMLAFFVAIVGRQVILLVLVLVSPLAFVAWLLPNTEKYFKKWSELFFTLLVLYPMVMLVFGAALLLSNLIGASGDSLDLSGG